MKFFYDNFTKQQIAGVFTPIHFVIATFYFALIALALVLSRNMNEKQVKRVTLIAAIICDAMELCKIVLRTVKGMPLDSWIPLYVSSLFLYASWLSLSKNKHLQRAGMSFLSFGSTTAGIFYMCYPSTSLLLYPAWHPASLHGIFYHWVILYIGMLTLIKRYQPRATDFFGYFIFFTAFAVPAVIINALTGSNLMFMNVPFALPPLQFFYDISPLLYLFGSFAAQSIALFWVWYGGTKLVHLLHRRTQNYEDLEVPLPEQSEIQTESVYSEE